MGNSAGTVNSGLSEAEKQRRAEEETLVRNTILNLVREAGPARVTSHDAMQAINKALGHASAQYTDYTEKMLSALQNDEKIRQSLREDIIAIVRGSKFTKLTAREVQKKLESQYNTNLSAYTTFIQSEVRDEQNRLILEEGKPVQQYLIGETLGKGHYGLVKAALHSQTREKFAIKMISLENVGNEFSPAQLNREIAIMQTLVHENVLRLHEVINTPSMVYLVLELVENGELFEAVQASTGKRQFPEDKARRYFQHLIMGVYYCHKKGVAHRDLKPANLLLTADDVLKISDFGLSSFQKVTDSGNVDESMRLRTCCGSPKYIAPEVIADNGYNGFLADIWSSGIILYLMLTGKTPFEHRTVTGLLKKVMVGQYTIPPEVPPGAANLISRMLVVNPENRIRVNQIIDHPWFQVGFDNTKAEAIRKMPGRVGSGSNLRDCDGIPSALSITESPSEVVSGKESTTEAAVSRAKTQTQMHSEGIHQLRQSNKPRTTPSKRT